MKNNSQLVVNFAFLPLSRSNQCGNGRMRMGSG